MDNRTLRRNLIAQRKKLSHQSRQALAAHANRHLFKLVKQLPKAANVALYQDAFGELPTFGIVQFCLRYGYTPHLPVVRGDKLVFAPIYPKYTDRHGVWRFAKKRHRLGMHEPISCFYRPIHQMDVIFCPLVAIDRQGNRMGMGGGFYDRSLANYQGLKIGWCYDFQQVAKLQTQPWDIAMDMMISDKRRLIF